MRGVLADINIVAHVDALLLIWASDTWREFWNDSGFVVENFPGLGLSHDATDAVIWRTCQREGLVLVTANRNQRGPDSLEGVIQSENQPDSLPVVTVADANRVLRESRLCRENRGKDPRLPDENRRSLRQRSDLRPLIRQQPL